MGERARSYQAGDRVLLHARVGKGAGRLPNGTTVFVTAVTPAGLAVVTDDRARHVLPAEFVTGRRRDGRPNVSHAWCRTVDGAQGGTWDHVHLLGTAALDNFTGYVGQSRARVETHTWNVRHLPAGDWGGRLADDRTGAQQVLDAERRAPLKTFAAHDDPNTLDRQLTAEIAEHRAVLAQTPPDVAARIVKVRDEIARAEQAARDAGIRIAYAEEQRRRRRPPRRAAPSRPRRAGQLAGSGRALPPRARTRRARASPSLVARPSSSPRPTPPAGPGWSAKGGGPGDWRRPASSWTATGPPPSPPRSPRATRSRSGSTASAPRGRRSRRRSAVSTPASRPIAAGRSPPPSRRSPTPRPSTARR